MDRCPICLLPMTLLSSADGPPVCDQHGAPERPAYAANVRLDGAALMLLRRLRRVYDAQDEDGRPCQLSDSELVARGLAALLTAAGVSAHVNAAMVAGIEPEPV